MINDNEISLELKKMDSGISFASPYSLERYIEYAKKHDLVFRHFPLLDCAFIVFNDITIILRLAEDNTTTLSLETT